MLLFGGDKGTQQRTRSRRPIGEGLEANVTETFSEWDAADHLRTPEDVRPYVQACTDEDPGDGSLIRAALNDVARGSATPRRGSDTTLVSIRSVPD